MNRRSFLTALAASLSISAAALTATATPAPTTETKRAVFDIKGMVTPNCPVLLKAAVHTVDGIVEVDASLEHKRAWVTYRVGATTTDAIIHTIADKTAYEAVLIRVE
jgi:copper chaperone CopZ